MTRLTWCLLAWSCLASWGMAQPPAEPGDAPQVVQDYPRTLQGVLQLRPYATVNFTDGALHLTMYSAAQKQRVDDAIAKFEAETAELQQERAELAQQLPARGPIPVRGRFEPDENGDAGETRAAIVRTREISQEVQSQVPQLFGKRWPNRQMYRVVAVGENYVMLRTNRGDTLYPLSSLTSVILPPDDEAGGGESPADARREPAATPEVSAAHE